MSAALAMAVHGGSELVAYSLDQLSRAVGELLQRAVAAGEICADIDPEDLLRTLVGMCYAHDRPGWQAKVLRLVDVFIDGLRRRPDKRDDRQASDALDIRTLMSAVHTSRKFGEFLICSTIVDICKAGKSFNHLGDSTAQNGSTI